jgi:uncharacterized membrane protein YfcA
MQNSDCYQAAMICVVPEDVLARNANASVTNGDGRCAVAPLFSPHFTVDTFFTILFAFLVCIVGIVGGVGGGGVLVPLYVGMGGLPMSDAVFLSLATVVGQSVVNLPTILVQHDPEFPRPGPLRPLAAFDVLALWFPASAAGTIIGTLLARLFPNWCRILLLLLVAIVIVYRVVVKARAQKRQDEAAAAGTSTVEDAEAAEQRQAAEFQAAFDRYGKGGALPSGDDGAAVMTIPIAGSVTTDAHSHEAIEMDDVFASDPADAKQKPLSSVGPTAGRHTDSSSHSGGGGAVGRFNLPMLGDAPGLLPRTAHNLQAEMAKEERDVARREYKRLMRQLQQQRNARREIILKLRGDIAAMEKRIFTGVGVGNLAGANDNGLDAPLTGGGTNELDLEIEAERMRARLSELEEEEEHDAAGLQQMQLENGDMDDLDDGSAPEGEVDDYDPNDKNSGRRSRKGLWHPNTIPRFQILEWAILVTLICLSIALTKIALDSHALMHCGSFGFWMGIVGALCVDVLFAVGYRTLMARKAARIASGDLHPIALPMEWTFRNSVILPALSGIAGVGSALLGIGGGMITNPLLLEAGLSPERASATGSVITGLVAIQSLALSIGGTRGQVRADWALTFAAIGAVTTLIGRYGLLRQIKRRRWTWLIVVAIGVVLTTTVVATVALGIVNVVHLLKYGASMAFTPLCDD